MKVDRRGCSRRNMIGIDNSTILRNEELFILLKYQPSFLLEVYRSIKEKINLFSPVCPMYRKSTVLNQFNYTPYNSRDIL